MVSQAASGEREEVVEDQYPGAAKDGEPPTIAELQEERQNVVGPFEALARQEHLLSVDEFSGGLLRGVIEHPACGKERCAQVISSMRRRGRDSFLDVLRQCLPREELAAFLATHLQALHQQRKEMSQLNAALLPRQKKPLELPLDHSEQLRYVLSCIDEEERTFLQRLCEDVSDSIRFLFHRPPRHHGQVEHLLVDTSFTALRAGIDPKHLAEDLSCLTLPPPPKHATIIEAVTPALATLEQIHHRRVEFDGSLLERVKGLQERARTVISKALAQATHLAEMEKMHHSHWYRERPDNERNNGAPRAEDYLHFAQSFPSPLATHHSNGRDTAPRKPTHEKIRRTGHGHSGNGEERGSSIAPVTAKAT